MINGDHVGKKESERERTFSLMGKKRINCASER